VDEVVDMMSKFKKVDVPGSENYLCPGLRSINMY
jgi:hypothetical protein